ncbi:MAG: LysR family transcriptional regulator [Pigmentiphaga sp.]
MNVTTRQLTAFISVAQLGSFTQAAEQVHLSQSGLSIMIRELEGQVGCKLFDRTTRSVRLTEAGALLLPIAIKARDDLAAAIGDIAALKIKQQQSLRIGCPPMLATSFLPVLFKEFRALHPDFALQLIDAKPIAIREQVKSGALDCGLGLYPKPISGIERNPVFQSPLLYIQTSELPPAATPLSQLPRLRWADLPALPLLKLPDTSPIQQLIERQLHASGLNIVEQGQFNHIETVIAMAAAGAGGAIIPAFAWGKCVRYGIEGAVLTEPDVTVDYSLITVKDKLSAEDVQKLSGALASALEKSLNVK